MRTDAKAAVDTTIATVLDALGVEHPAAPSLTEQLQEARATIQRVHRLLQADEMGLKTYGITRDDLRAALTGRP
ncbi:hypothetical protein GS914_00010 [Rhodococcus hoagii]|nr:hypothetical protein [Prescottella equi]